MTKLLSGDSRCEWASWFKSHFRYQKLPDANEASLVKWKLEHEALMRRIESEMAAVGWTVYREQDCEFRLKGRTAILAGRPDLLAVREGEARVVDGKTGSSRGSDQTQVMLYLYALPQARRDLTETVWRWSGQVAYGNGIAVDVPPPTPEQRTAFAALIRRVGADEPPKRSPSRSECAQCPISAADCPDRMEAADAPEGVTSEF